ncbi:MAG: NAD(P)-binding domain-containing protein [Bacteroidetes bacterium]|nr:NAD(P)-binding domain-containing protein [Bacteroidota bacterium]MBS1632831.1 NAD(P)-binding domain-containing protein [Bacteroidota bacterium]
MKIGIIGSGIVGRVLGNGFLSEGNDVMLGTRNVQKDEVVKWKNENPKGKIGGFEETAKFGDLIVLATNGLATEQIIDSAGVNNFSDKVVIDATNPIAAAPPTNGVLHYFTSMNESLMERIQKKIPKAKIVKAFNSIGNAFMYKPNFPGGKPTMFICGNDDTAKKIVTDILTAFGHETEDMGKVEAARAIEPLAILWCIPGFIRNQWANGFKLLKM